MLNKYNSFHPTRKRNRKKASQQWTNEEDQLLSYLVQHTSSRMQWQTISIFISGHTPQQIMNRWNKVINPSLVKGSWSKQEDQILTNWVKENGEIHWTKAASLLKGRTGKQCRERWMNCLKPEIRKAEWTPEEDELIIRLQKQIGNKWAKISEKLPGRTDNSVKNRWNSVLKKRLNNENIKQFDLEDIGTNFLIDNDLKQTDDIIDNLYLKTEEQKDNFEHLWPEY